MKSALPDFLISYLEQRDARRAEAVNSVLNKLTDRELRLVKEAAIAGYVEGAMDNGGRSAPNDATIVVRAIETCLANADRYPTLGQEPS